MNVGFAQAPGEAWTFELSGVDESNLLQEEQDQFSNSQALGVSLTSSRLFLGILGSESADAKKKKNLSSPFQVKQTCFPKKLPMPFSSQHLFEERLLFPVKSLNASLRNNPVFLSHSLPHRGFPASAALTPS